MIHKAHPTPIKCTGRLSLAYAHKLLLSQFKNSSINIIYSITNVVWCHPLR